MSENRLQKEPKDLDTTQQGYTGITPPRPPRGQLPKRSERIWVDRPEQLLAAVQVLKQFPIVAVDAEFTQARSHFQQNASASIGSTPRLALLQLAIEGSCFVIDTLRLHDLSPLKAVLGNPNVAVLLHGAGADLRVMAERGLEVVYYYDLEATSRSIFGQQESSLAAMLQRAFGIHLDKSLQRTDWTRRPLPPAMMAYAARDAEGTFALYFWLDEHYHDILKLHENTAQPDSVASWIEPFLRGHAPLTPEAAVAEAKAEGLVRNKAQVIADCRVALEVVSQPMRRSRLLRLIADLSLVQLVPDIVPLLHARTSDERAASTRALGRLGVKSVRDELRPLLQDAVGDVRKAAQTALRNLGEKEPRQQRASSTKAADGTRTWAVGTDSASSDDDDWKTRLRSMIGE